MPTYTIVSSEFLTIDVNTECGSIIYSVEVIDLATNSLLNFPTFISYFPGGSSLTIEAFEEIQIGEYRVEFIA